MENVTKPSTLSGFMELLPREQLIFDDIKNVLEKTYRLYGFVPLDTPILEHSEVLLAKAGGETEKQIYRFTKGDTDLTMRFDLTVPLAKYAALHQNDLVFPFRRYQIGKAYRGERAQRGRFREFYQSDIDIIGDNELSIINDAEMPSVIYEILTKLGIEDFTVRINNRKVLGGFFAMLGQENNTADIMRILDKIEKIGRENVKKELSQLGLSEAIACQLVDFVETKGENSEVLNKLREMSDGNALFEEGVSELIQVTKYVKDFGVPEKNFAVDLSIARGLDYYTGTVYETRLNKHPEIGSVCSGGRYDNLAGHYTNRKLPGVGISIGLTRLFYILNDMKYLNTAKNAPVDVLLIPMTDDMNMAFGFARKLRQNGINTQVYFEKKKFKSKISYADKIGASFAVFIGEDEIKSGMVSLKNLAVGEQVTVSGEEAVNIINERLSARKNEKFVKGN